jgi:hypothetical protein
MIWKTSEKKNKTEMQNKMEGHTSRLPQAEDRISELENEILIKGKLKNSRQLKYCERKMQECTNSIKGQTQESWVLKKEKKCKQKDFVTYSTK